MKRPYDEQDSASEAGPNFMDNKKKELADQIYTCTLTGLKRKRNNKKKQLKGKEA